jgi:hypothetical protein
MRIRLTRRERAEVVAFMRALTDNAGTTARPRPAARAPAAQAGAGTAQR